MTESDYKIPELEAIQTELQQLTIEIGKTVSAMIDGTLFTDGELSIVRHARLSDRARLLAEKFTGAQDKQQHYNTLLASINEAIEERARHTIADILLTKIDDLKRRYAVLQEYKRNDGRNTLEKARRHARLTGLSDDIIDAVCADGLAKLTETTQNIQQKFSEPEKVS